MRGIGIYTRQITIAKHGPPKQAAKRAKDHGLSFVFMLGCWQELRDGKVRSGSCNTKTLAPYAEAFIAAGIEVGIWGYPWVGHERQYMDTLAEQIVVTKAPVKYLLHDPELGMKWKLKARPRKVDATMRAEPEAIPHVGPPGTEHASRTGAKFIMDVSEDLEIKTGVTSYGMAHFHPNFPWAEFLGHPGCEFVSPQLYRAEPSAIDRGIAEWYKHRPTGVSMIPSIGTFGPKSEHALHAHLSNFIDGEESVDGFLAWEWICTSANEWKTLARWSEWAKRGLLEV